MCIRDRHGLGEDRAGEDAGEERAGQCRDRERGMAQRVTQAQLRLADAACPHGQGERLEQGFFQPVAQDLPQQGRERQAQRDGCLLYTSRCV